MIALTIDSVVEWLQSHDAINSYPHDDIGSARLLSDILGKSCRYNATAGRWYAHNGQYWDVDPGGLIIRQKTKVIAKGLITYANLMAGMENDNNYQKYANKWSDYKKRNTIIQDARDLNFFRSEDCDTDPNILNCQNGTLILHQDKIEFIPHDPDLLLTQIANVSYIPGASCCLWERFAGEVMQDNQDKIHYLQKLLGVCSTGYNKLERMWYLHGQTARNGKSTMVETIFKMLGTYAASIRPETLAVKQHSDSRAASPDIAKLDGKRLVVASEPKEGMILDSALIKALTGGDTISARMLYHAETQFTPRFKLLINTNHLPVVTDTTIFDSDRVQVIPFDRHFAKAERDVTLKDKLSADESLSGILNWCLQGWLLFCREGLDEPAAIRQATAAYAGSADKLQLFTGDCLVSCDGRNIPIKILYDRYTDWCSKNKLQIDNKSSFISNIKSKGLYRPTGTVDGKTVRNVMHGYDFANK